MHGFKLKKTSVFSLYAITIWPLFLILPNAVKSIAQNVR